MRISITAVPKPPCSEDTAAARLSDKLLRTGFVRIAGSQPANQPPFLPNQRWYFARIPRRRNTSTPSWRPSPNTIVRSLCVVRADHVTEFRIEGVGEFPMSQGVWMRIRPGHPQAAFFNPTHGVK